MDRITAAGGIKARTTSAVSKIILGLRSVVSSNDTYDRTYGIILKRLL